ncbi:hypothetical protein TNCV_2044701 [Trichonephila clavipes]|nr:hypothetical protein TNCV_2044701 [Trichonephila clavipes]
MSRPNALNNHSFSQNRAIGRATEYQRKDKICVTMPPTVGEEWCVSDRGQMTRMTPELAPPLRTTTPRKREDLDP